MDANSTTTESDHVGSGKDHPLASNASRRESTTSFVTIGNVDQKIFR
jgi:hypothetical protein